MLYSSPPRELCLAQTISAVLETGINDLVPPARCLLMVGLARLMIWAVRRSSGGGSGKVNGRGLVHCCP